MNIEEERKAYDAFCASQYSRDKWFMYANEEEGFSIWKAAKEHAAEMAKLQVVIKPKGPGSEPSSYPWIVKAVSGPCPGVLEDFRTEEDAVEWATNCGYRMVIE